MRNQFIKANIIRPVRDFVLYYGIKLLCLERYIVPRKIACAWHTFIASLVYPFLKKFQRTIFKNLTIAYGNEKSDKEKRHISRKLFFNLANTFNDYAWWSHKTSRSQFLKYFTVEGEEHLAQAYKKGKGVLCLVPHTCGWEFSAIMPPILGYETSAVSSRIKSPAFNRLMIELRQSRGMKNFSRQDHCYDKLVQALNNGDCMIIMIDQDSRNIHGEFLEFFGQRAYTPLGCARLAMNSGAAIVPMFTVRTGNGKYLFKILPEIPLQITGNRETDILTNTQIHNNVIEQIVREYPEQWLWMHNRWDTTPGKLAIHLYHRQRRKQFEALEKIQSAKQQ